MPTFTAARPTRKNGATASKTRPMPAAGRADAVVVADPHAVELERDAGVARHAETAPGSVGAHAGVVAADEIRVGRSLRLALHEDEVDVRRVRPR